MWLRFARYYKKHLKLFIIDLIAASLVAGLDLIFPYLSRIVVDDAIPNNNVNLVIKVGVISVIFYIIRAMAQFVMNYWGHIMGARIEHDMRQDLFEHMQKLSSRFFDKNKVGKLMSRMTNDLREVSEFSHHAPEDLFLSIVMFIGSFFILVNYNLVLTLIIFTIVIVGVLFSVYMRTRMLQAFRVTRAKIADMNAIIENSLAGIRLTKVFTNQKLEINRFSEINGEYRNSWDNAYYQMGWFFSVNQFILALVNVTTLTVGGVFVYFGYISIGTLFAYILYVTFFMQPIRRLLMLFEQIQRGTSGIERFFKIMDEEVEIKDGEIEFVNPKGKVEFKDVYFKYEEDTEMVFKGLNLTIEPGQTVALVGESGVGKTTITKLIPRLYDVTAGSIEIDGVDIREYTTNSLRKQIGHVQQDVFILHGSVYDNILYGKYDATEEEVILAAKLANIHDFILTLPKGYQTDVGERGVKLSGGQKQRISLARVFLKNPPMLILDEATSALDNQTERLIQDSIEKIAHNRTTVIVAHRLTTIQNSDRILVFTDDGIVEDGSHQELMNQNGIYKSLYEASDDGFIE